MKKTQKLFCLLLAVITVLPVFAACKKDEQTNNGTTTDEQNTIAGIAQKDYGRDFTIVNPIDNFYDDYYWSEDEGDSSNIAIANYRRELVIENHLGIEIFHETLPSDEGVLYSTLEQMNLSGSDDYQLAMTHPFVDLVSLMSAEYLKDLSEVSQISMNDEYYISISQQHLKTQYIFYNPFFILSRQFRLCITALLATRALGKAHTPYSSVYNSS